MTHPKVPIAAPDRERRRAADLRTGDRIVSGDLLGKASPEEVLGVHLFADYAGAQQVLVVLRDSSPGVFTHYFRADESVALDAAGAEVPATVEGHPEFTGRTNGGE